MATVADEEGTAPTQQAAVPSAPAKVGSAAEAPLSVVSLAPEAETATEADTAVVSCDARLLRRFSLRAPVYPGRHRVDYGSATVTLRYVIDEQGNTMDDSVEVMAQASSATKPTFFDLFANEARKVVERYRYEFDAPSDGICEKRQRLTRQFVYQYDR